MKPMYRRLVMGLVVAGLCAGSIAQASWDSLIQYPPAWDSNETTTYTMLRHRVTTAYYAQVLANKWGRTHVKNMTWDLFTPNGSGVYIQADSRCYDVNGSRGWMWKWYSSGYARVTQGEQKYTGCPNWSVQLYGRGWLWGDD